MIAAIGRIERALARIEAIDPPSAEAAGPLRERHELLRREAGGALAELDALVARLGKKRLGEKEHG